MIENGHYLGAKKMPCDFFNERPEGEDISCLVIHNISLPPNVFGEDFIHRLFAGTLDCQAHPYFEQLRGLEVSSHIMIDRHGQVFQYVPFDKRAWHAGKSRWMGRENCNDFSIGIELEGADDVEYTTEQYDSLIKVTMDIVSVYDRISMNNIVGHSDIAPGRKTDPGPAFDWKYFRQQLKDNGYDSD